MIDLKLFVSLVVIAAVFGLINGFVGAIDREEEVAQEELYCEMVTTYQESKGDYGWPDYNNNYNEVCPE